MKKFIAIAAVALTTTACVQLEPNDVLEAAKQCHNAGLQAGSPSHTVCVEHVAMDHGDHLDRRATVAQDIQTGLAIVSFVMLLAEASNY